jgi:hypothetical protein
MVWRYYLTTFTGVFLGKAVFGIVRGDEALR